MRGGTTILAHLPAAAAADPRRMLPLQAGWQARRKSSVKLIPRLSKLPAQAAKRHIPLPGLIYLLSIQYTLYGCCIHCFPTCTLLPYSMLSPVAEAQSTAAELGSHCTQMGGSNCNQNTVTSEWHTSCRDLLATYPQAESEPSELPQATGTNAPKRCQQNTATTTQDGTAMAAQGFGAYQQPSGTGTATQPLHGRTPPGGYMTGMLLAHYRELPAQKTAAPCNRQPSATDTACCHLNCCPHRNLEPSKLPAQQNTDTQRCCQPNTEAELKQNHLQIIPAAAPNCCTQGNLKPSKLPAQQNTDIQRCGQPNTEVKLEQSYPAAAPTNTEAVDWHDNSCTAEWHYDSSRCPCCLPAAEGHPTSICYCYHPYTACTLPQHSKLDTEEPPHTAAPPWPNAQLRPPEGTPNTAYSPPAANPTQHAEGDKNQGGPHTIHNLQMEANAGTSKGHSHTHYLTYICHCYLFCTGPGTDWRTAYMLPTTQSYLTADNTIHTAVPYTVSLPATDDAAENCCHSPPSLNDELKLTGGGAKKSATCCPSAAHRNSRMAHPHLPQMTSDSTSSSPGAQHPCQPACYTLSTTYYCYLMTRLHLRKLQSSCIRTHILLPGVLLILAAACLHYDRAQLLIRRRNMMITIRQPTSSTEELSSYLLSFCICTNSYSNHYGCCTKNCFLVVFFSMKQLQWLGYWLCCFYRLFCDTVNTAEQISLGESVRGSPLTIHCNTAACCCK